MFYQEQLQVQLEKLDLIAEGKTFFKQIHLNNFKSPKGLLNLCFYMLCVCFDDFHRLTIDLIELQGYPNPFKVLY